MDGEVDPIVKSITIRLLSAGILTNKARVDLNVYY